MLKKLAVLFAVLALVAAACASSGEDDDATTTTAAGDTTETTTAPDDTTETTTAPDAGDGADVGAGDGGDTLAAVQERGILNCGVSTGAPGFTEISPDGTFAGFDVDFCRAFAAAVLGDAQAVEFFPLTSGDRFTALNLSTIDVLSRNTTWTQTRDTDLTNDFVTTTFYDGQQIMGDPAKLPSLTDGMSFEEGMAAIDGAIVCTNAGTTTEQNIKEGTEAAGSVIELETVENFPEAMEKFIAGTCDVVTTDGSGLFGHRSNNIDVGTPGADGWVIFPESPISKEPLGPLVREGDSTWFDIIQWTVFATFAAEEFEIDSTNVDAMMEGGGEVGRLLGGEGEKQTAMGLSADAFAQVIKQVGNYAEIYDRNLGPLNLAREGTLNLLWTDGGLLYSPPFR